MATRTVGPGKDHTTIAAAILACNDNPGSRAAMDIVLVDPGTYNEMLDCRATSGGWLIPCIVRAADATNMPIITSTGAAQAVRADANYRGTAVGELTLEDLIFSGWSGTGNGVIYTNSTGLIVRRCKFTGCTNSRTIRTIKGSASRFGLVDSCEFVTSGATTGLIVGDSAYTDVINCKAICPTNVPFYSDLGGASRYIEHNSILGTWNSAGGTDVITVTGGTARGNIAQNLGTGGRYGIYEWGAGNYIENIFYGSFTTRFYGTDGGGNQNVDPLFSNTGSGTENLSLQSTSPAIGALARSANTLLDILGFTRSDPTDAGAYMYVSANAWSAFGSDTFASVSGDFTINRNLNLSGHWKKRSGLSLAQNGANAVTQVPFSLGTPGPASLRGRNKPYAQTTNTSASNTPGSQGF